MRPLLLVLLIILSPVVKADGNRLLADCQSIEQFMDKGESRNDTGSGFCMGLIQGVRTSMQVLNDLLEPKYREYRVCFPDGGINNGQGVRVVLKYLRNNPEILNMDESVLVMRAYKNAYPCVSK